jgi:hypothetical protein
VYASKERNDKTHYLVLQLPGIPRNQIRASTKDGVLSFTATIPSGQEHLTSRNVKSANSKSKGTLVTGQQGLAFPLPRGSVQTIQEMKFTPPASQFRGLLTVTIPSTTTTVETEYL